MNAALQRAGIPYADLLYTMRELLASDIAVDEADLCDDWLEAVKDAGIPASRYQAMPARQVLRQLEKTGDAVREVDRGNGVNIAITRWAGRGYVPRTFPMSGQPASKAPPKPKTSPRWAAKPQDLPPPSVEYLLRELAQVRSQLQRIEAQIEAMT
jgi:hypothetical protein